MGVRWKDVLQQDDVPIVLTLEPHNAQELQIMAEDERLALADGVEWRLDAWAGFAEVAADERRRILEQGVDCFGAKPLLLTFRTADEGGGVALTSKAYVRVLDEVVDVLSGARCDATAEWCDDTGVDQCREADAKTRPDVCLDVEWKTAKEAAPRLVQAAHASGAFVLFSIHELAHTPPRAALVAAFEDMWEGGCDIAKIAAMPKEPDDVSQLMTAGLAASKHHANRYHVAISMGERGMLTRYLPMMTGSCLTFACLDQPAAPGQIDIVALREVMTTAKERFHLF